ncbi:aminoglycoside phosphotransferase family protein [Nocardioides iriomotensis]|nr:aminoglycoside phosphotransferase family protein [Nocardioides iriomotensis]
MLQPPAGLRERALLGEHWADWLDRLPRTMAELLEEWDLTLDPAGDHAMHGFGSWVLPVHDRDGEPAALKVTIDTEDETEHEHLALQRWAGEGAVRLLRADPHRRALLLERLHRRDLSSLGYVESAEVVGGLYRRLHVPAPPQLRTFTSYVERWTGPLAGLPRDAPIPHRLVEQALATYRDLATDPASTGTLMHHDLHDFNGLAGDREPWLAIDPQAMSGDVHAEPAPMLWNRWDEVTARGRIRDDVRDRFFALVDTAELDEDRARAWVVVRLVLNAYWAIEDAQKQGRGLTADDREWITRCITIVKAVQD